MKKTIIKTIFFAMLLVIAVFSIASCTTDENSGDHVHSFIEKVDDSGRFMECACGEIKNKIKHNFEWIIDSEPTYTDVGIKHQECSACGYKTNENTAIHTLMEKNEDNTLKLKEELILALSDYLGQLTTCYDIPANTFEMKIDWGKNFHNPLFVKFGNESYYAAAYCTSSHYPEEEYPDYCCRDEYVWVGFENAEDVKESWEGKGVVAAFQIDLSEFCKNLKTGNTDFVMEHFSFYLPEFVNDVALKPEVTFDNTFIYLTESNKDIIYYSLDIAYHEPWSIDCVELDGEYYATYPVSKQVAEGGDGEAELSVFFGKYYDRLTEIMVIGKYSKEYKNHTQHYALFKIADLEAIMSE